MTSEPEEKRAGVHRVKHFIFTRCLPRSRSVSATRQELSGTVDKDYFCDLPTPSLPVLRANFSEHITSKFVAQLPNQRKVWRLVKGPLLPECQPQFKQHSTDSAEREL